LAWPDHSSLSFTPNYDDGADPDRFTIDLGDQPDVVVTICEGPFDTASVLGVQASMTAAQSSLEPAASRTQIHGN
jgi:hypothetical protein